MMGDEDIEKQFLVGRIKETIEKLINDSDQQNCLGKLSSLNGKLEQLKKALNSQHAKKPNKETLYSIKNLLGELQIPSNRSSPRFLFNFISQINTLKKEIDGVSKDSIHKKEIDDVSNDSIIIPNEAENINQNVDVLATLPELPKLSTRSPDSVHVHGVDDRIRFLVRRFALRRDNDGTEFRAVGISGMRGVGKTMLCQQLFKHQTIQSYFLPRIWVCLTKIRDDEDHRIVIVKRILSALGVEQDVVKYAYDKHNVEGLLFLLRVNLVGKNYLIVLDDAPKEDEEKFFSGLNKDEDSRVKLAYGLPKGSGGAVMVTSRWEERVKLMVGSENSQILTANLDPESCWLIFKDEIEKWLIFKDEIEKENQHEISADMKALKDEISADMKALKDEIVKKCDGLPLAAKLLGKLAVASDKNE